MTKRFAEWVRKTMDKRKGAVSILRTVDGNIFHGISRNIDFDDLHEDLQKALRYIAQHVEVEGFHGKCSEVDAIDQALKAGADLEGAIMETVSMSPKTFRRAKAACVTCNPLLKMFKIISKTG